MDDGRVWASVQEQVVYQGELEAGAAPMTRIRMVLSDLGVEDLKRVTAPDG
jgi:hypothetical protein